MNKRPLPCVLAGFVLGEVWMWQFHGTAALAALCFVAIICMMIGMLRRSSFFFFLSIGIIIGGIRENTWNICKSDLFQWKNESEYMIQGQIEEIHSKEYSYSLIISELYIEGISQDGKLLLYLKNEPECRIGSRIFLKGIIEDFELPTNPGEFNQRVYREGRGILGVMKNPQVIEIRLGSFLIKDGIYEIRNKSSEYIRNHMREDLSGIGAAMALGDKTYLPEKQKSLYEFAGISHVLAVSGLHMSLLGAAIYKILRKCGFPYSISVCSSIPCIIIYAVMTGLSSSCLRATIMLIIYLFAELKGYYYDLISALSLAGIWLLYEIPARLFDSGFLLSFGAMISVGIVCPFLFRIFKYKTGIHRIRDSFLSGAIITLFSIPLALSFFYGFSLAGIFLNLVVIPLMTVLLPFLFVGSMGWFPLIPDIIAYFCLKTAELLLKLYSFLCSLAEQFPIFYIQAGYRNIKFAIGYYILLFIVIAAFYYLFVTRKKRSVFMVIAISCCFILFIHYTGRNDNFMTILDVGQGDGILYHSQNGEVCMIDGGSTSEKNIGQYILKPALEYYGIRKVDYWFLSHMDEDHISGAKELLASGYPIRNLILPVRKEIGEKQREIETLARLNNTRIYYMKQGDKLKLKDNIFYCIYPKNNTISKDENQNSLVLMLETSNQQILLTGDIENEGEEQMIRYLKNLGLNYDKDHILKVGHHGSSNATKESLLKIFEPDTALVSCALKNRYGHPSKETIDRLKKINASVFFTMRHGAIEVRLGKETSYLGYGVVK